MPASTPQGSRSESPRRGRVSVHVTEPSSSRSTVSLSLSRMLMAVPAGSGDGGGNGHGGSSERADQGRCSAPTPAALWLSSMLYGRRGAEHGAQKLQSSTL